MKRLSFRQLFATILLTAASIGSTAQGLQLQWVKSVSGTDDVDAGPMVIDAQKNLYIAGSFKGVADFDPGAGTATLSTSTGFANAGAYLAKYDGQGAYVFAYKLADNGNLAVSSMALDHSGNICVTGIFDSTIDFDPGPGTALLTSAGSLDIFVARYSAGGAYINAFRLGGSGIDAPNAIATDPSGNLYVTGSFKTTADFDPGTGTKNLVSAGDADIFLAKYSGSGVLDFAFRIGGSSLDDGYGLAVDAAGNAYLGGNFGTTADLDPGPGTAIFTFGGINGFFAKYSPSGNYLTGFAYDLGTVNEVALDPSGNVYLAGRFQDSIDADPGTGVAKFYSVNGNDIYLTKLDAGGNFLRATAFRSNGSYAVSGIATNHRSSIYIYGWLRDTVYCDPVSATGRLTTNGADDGFLTRFDAAGNLALGATFGGPGSDLIRTAAPDGQGDIWIAGFYNQTVDFDPSPANVSLTAGPKAALFFGRYTDLDAVGVRGPAVGGAAINVYGSDKKVFVDFSALQQVNGRVRVSNLMGQTVVETTHSRNDMLKLSLPDGPPQVYIVTVTNDGQITAKKVWTQ